MTNETDGNGLMTVSEAARYLRVSRSTIYEACRCNEIPHLRIRGRIRILKKVLDNMATGARN